MTVIIKSDKPFAGSVKDLPAIFSKPFNVSSVVLAVGARLLIPNYSGAIIRLRQGATEQDFKANSLGVLSKTEIENFSKGGDVFVTKLYDQSGKGKHLARSDVSAQPIIVKSGKVCVDEWGLPTVRFSGAQGLVATNITTSGTLVPQLATLTSFNPEPTGSKLYIWQMSTSSAVGLHSLAVSPAGGLQISHIGDSGGGSWVQRFNILGGVLDSLSPNSVFTSVSTTDKAVMAVVKGTLSTVSVDVATNNGISSVSLGTSGPTYNELPFKGDISYFVVVNSSSDFAELSSRA